MKQTTYVGAHVDNQPMTSELQSFIAEMEKATPQEHTTLEQVQEQQGNTNEEEQANGKG